MANWIGHIFCRNCFIQHFIEGEIKERIKVTRRRGGRRKKLLCYPEGKRGYSKLKEETPDCTMCKNRVARGCEPVVSQTTGWMNEWMNEWISGDINAAILSSRHIWECTYTEAFVASALGDGESSVTEIGSYKMPTAVICPSLLSTWRHRHIYYPKRLGVFF
jgi:hypothetical protein